MSTMYRPPATAQYAGTPTTEYAMPQHCPSWCEGEHQTALDDGCDSREAAEHRSRRGFGAVLHEQRNPIDGRVVRRGGGGWDLAARQASLPDGLGYEEVAQVKLEARGADDSRADLHLTSGEARSLARQLVALADDLDLR